MYNVIDVANYVVNRSIDLDAPVSNLKLQKLLYYVQAAKLVELGEAMFSSEISAWRYGPVVEPVYHKFKIYANSQINNKIEDRGVDFMEDLLSNGKYDPCNVITINDQKIIDGVIVAYKHKSAMELVRKTHFEAPWKNAFENGQEYITKESIRNYYTENFGNLYG